MRYKPQEDTWVWILMGYQSAKMFASLKCVYNLKNYVWSWLQWKQFLISAVFVFLCNQSHNRQLQTWCSAETARNEANTSSVTLLEAHRNTLQSLSLFNPSFIQSSKPCCAVSLTSTFTATVRVIWASNTEHSFMEMCFARSSSDDEKMFWFLQPRDLSSAPSPPSFEFFGTADLLLVNIFCAHSHSHQEVTYWFLVPPPITIHITILLKDSLTVGLTLSGLFFFFKFHSEIFSSWSQKKKVLSLMALTL